MSEAITKKPVAMGVHGIEITQMDDALRFCRGYVEALVDHRGKTNEEIAKALVKLQTGLELGLPPMAALSQVYVVHGRVALQGTALLALARRSREFDDRP